MKLVAEKNNTKISIRVYEDADGVAHIERLHPNPLRWSPVMNPSLGRPMNAEEFAKFNRIPLVETA